MKHKLLFAASAVMVGNEHRPWHLPEPIIVRLSEADYDIFEIHGLQVSPKVDMYVMDSEGNWFPLSDKDLNADKMIDAIHQFIMKCFKNRSVEVAA